MTRQEAIEYVRSCDEDEGPESYDAAAEIFAALYGRAPTADDGDQGDVWSLCCAAVEEACTGPREWDVNEQGYGFATVVASSADEARKRAREWLAEHGSGYDLSEGTVHATYGLHCELTDETDSFNVTWEQDEPECEAGAHDWQCPIEIVGGIKENPGVWGHGGGVIMHRVCMHCGCGKTIDTWAQNPCTGEQGLTEVTYEPGRYSEELAEYHARNAEGEQT